ncbi:MAG: hypothetical protein AAFY05_23425, partial [Pseudomonadota bacterium]
ASGQVIWSNKPSINRTLHPMSGPFSTDIDFFEQIQSIDCSTDPNRGSVPQGLARSTEPCGENQSVNPARNALVWIGFNEKLVKCWIFAILQRTIRCK